MYVYKYYTVDFKKIYSSPNHGALYQQVLENMAGRVHDSVLNRPIPQVVFDYHGSVTQSPQSGWESLLHKSNNFLSQTFQQIMVRIVMEYHTTKTRCFTSRVLAEVKTQYDA